MLRGYATLDDRKILCLHMRKFKHRKRNVFVIFVFFVNIITPNSQKPKLRLSTNMLFVATNIWTNVFTN